MSKEVKKLELSVGPFGVRIDAPGQKDFDQYYLDVEEKIVFKKTGQVDENGDELGVEDIKHVVKKIDIRELLNSQKDTVGVDAYVRALMVQGVDINELNTSVSDRVDDYSQFPDTLAEAEMSGHKAAEIFNNLDPALKGDHTTIEGFLNSLSKESIDSYIKGRIEALTPKKEGNE